MLAVGAALTPLAELIPGAQAPPWTTDQPSLESWVEHPNDAVRTYIKRAWA